MRSVRNRERRVASWTAASRDRTGGTALHCTDTAAVLQCSPLISRCLVPPSRRRLLLFIRRAVVGDECRCADGWMAAAFPAEQTGSHGRSSDFGLLSDPRATSQQPQPSACDCDQHKHHAQACTSPKHASARAACEVSRISMHAARGAASPVCKKVGSSKTRRLSKKCNSDHGHIMLDSTAMMTQPGTGDGRQGEMNLRGNADRVVEHRALQAANFCSVRLGLVGGESLDQSDVLGLGGVLRLA